MKLQELNKLTTTDDMINNFEKKEINFTITFAEQF